MLTEETAKKLDEAMKILKTEGRLDPFIIDFIFDSMKDFDKFGKAYNKGAYNINMKLIDLEHRIKELEKFKKTVELLEDFKNEITKELKAIVDKG